MSIERRYANIGHQHDALDIAFDNTDSGLAAEDVQEAIDEVVASLEDSGYPKQLAYAGIF